MNLDPKPEPPKQLKPFHAYVAGILCGVACSLILFLCYQPAPLLAKQKAADDDRWQHELAKSHHARYTQEEGTWEMIPVEELATDPTYTRPLTPDMPSHAPTPESTRKPISKRK